MGNTKNYIVRSELEHAVDSTNPPRSRRPAERPVRAQQQLDPQ